MVFLKKEKKDNGLRKGISKVESWKKGMGMGGGTRGVVEPSGVAILQVASCDRNWDKFSVAVWATLQACV